MSWLKFSLVLSTGVMFVGLSNRMALSQDGPPPPERGSGWEGGPPEGTNPVRPPRRPGDERGARPPRENDDSPPGPPEMRGGPDGQRPQPPDRGPRGSLPPPGGPDGDRNGPPPLDGDRPQPPGYAPRGPDDFEALKTRDPELFKAMQADFDLERQTRDQVEHYRRAGKGDQAKVKEKLVEIVNKHFEVRQQLRNLEVKHLEQQLKDLRDKIDQREKKRKEIVDKRISELIGADEGEHF